jgi:molybdate transport system substrate-binding protein
MRNLAQSRLRLRPLALAAALALAPCMLHADTITVFAASSLKDALDAVAADWQTSSGHTVTIAYGGSPQLAKQIEEGAPADLFLSASPEWMDVLQEKSLIKTGSRVDLLGNTLVLIANGANLAPVTLGPDLDLPALIGTGKLAMAQVDTVPAGVYGKQALEHFGLWSQAEPLVAQTENVRAALALVATGEASYGIVYASDAIAALAAGDAVSVVATFPDDSHDAITYPAALVTDSPAAAAFLDHLTSDVAEGVFTDQGFSVLK